MEARQSSPVARPGIEVAGRTLGAGRPFLLAGPCVLENLDLACRIAGEVAELCADRDVPYVFKASFDKANRTSAGSRRGPGLGEGLDMLAQIKQRTGLPVLTDVHLPEQCARAAEVVDILQIPAFLCRQTDLLVAAAETGAAVNVKKGQFLAPWDAKHCVDKVRSAGNPNVILTERGASFGYGRLVVDLAGFPDLAAAGVPLVMDSTHAVQQPGGADGKTGGDRTRVPLIARGAAATGLVDGFFFEVHPDPESSPSDAANMVRLEQFPGVLDGVLAVHRSASNG